MLKKIFLVLLILVIGFVVLVAFQPSDFRITRSTMISAPIEVVFSEVNDLRNWQSWSPWEKLDPSAKKSFEGPAAGVGASFSWAGNNEVGEGRMTITESRSNEFIKFKLEFLKPFEATNTAEFNFKNESNQTSVTWSMYGKNNFIGKAIGLIMDCEKMVGGQFEKGLSQLKSLTETARK